MKNLLWFSMLLMAITAGGCKETGNDVINNYYDTDALTDPNVKPKVVFTYPANGSIGPFDNFDPQNATANPQITIQLNKLVNVMDLGSHSITLKTGDSEYPLTLADYLYNGSSYQYRDPLLRNILIFYADRKYLANKIYTVTIDTTLTDIHGNRLGTQYSFSFTPEPQFRVYSGGPTHDRVSPESFGPLSINFNSKLDSTIFSKIQISPSLKGKWRFDGYYYSPADSSFVIFNTKDTLSFDTKYTVSVSADAKDASGLAIKEAFQYSFTSAPFEVTSWGYSLPTAPGGFTYHDNFNFSFNGLLDTSTVRTSITITPSLPFSISFSSFGNDFKTVYMNLQEDQILPNTTYLITLATSLRSKKGAYLKVPFTHSFNTDVP